MPFLLIFVFVFLLIVFFSYLEAKYSFKNDKQLIPMVMQANYKADGWLGIIIGSTVYIDFTKSSFYAAFSRLVREIETIRIDLGIDEHENFSR
jgi:hypothetical protein